MAENENVNEVVETTTTENEQPKTYSEEEVQALLQREADRRVSSALAKQKKDYEKKLSLAKLDEEQRAAAEKDARIEELQARLAEFEVEKNRSELKSVLSSRGLSAEFADLIQITDDLTESQDKIDRLDKLFKAAVAEEVKKRLASNNPNVGTANGDGGKTFKEMSLAEKSALYQSNPELYKKLSQ
jgi:hypothetical protein